MAHCKKCGKEISPGRRLCFSCLDNWHDTRMEAFRIAEEKFGKLCATNHKALTKEVLRLERQWKKEKLNES